jgi:VWFA-related protein
LNEFLQNDSMGYEETLRDRQQFRGASFLAIALTAVLLFVSVAGSQTSGEIIRVSTELVGFEVTVTDGNGKPVRGLSADEFRVIEMGQELTINFFSPVKSQDRQRPLSIVFALDVSGSMTAAEIDKLADAFRLFVQRLADNDSYFSVVTFSMDVKTVLPFTNRRDRIERSISGLSRNIQGLSTHAYDAADHAIRTIVRSSPRSIRGRFPKRAVILITDGFPVGDVVSPQTVIERANAAEISIFAVLMPSFSSLQRDGRPLLTPLEASGIVSGTGGKIVHATSGDFEPVFAAIAEEIASSYVIAFYPQSQSVSSGNFQEVKIESKSGYAVKQNRSGYFRQK